MGDNLFVFILSQSFCLIRLLRECFRATSKQVISNHVCVGVFKLEYCLYFPIIFAYCSGRVPIVMITRFEPVLDSYMVLSSVLYILDVVGDPLKHTGQSEVIFPAFNGFHYAIAASG